jgi:pimeloyl-ACP methyl ester carboxylesterase
MPIVNANGVDLYYEVMGEGPPLVVINGLGGEVSEYKRITGPLAERCRVLAFDNRGAGRSDKPDTPYTVEVMAMDAAAVMDGAGFKGATVMGISMGGRIALELCLQRPDLAGKLVLVSTGARVQNSWVRRLVTSPPPRVLMRSKYPQPKYAFLRQREASKAYDGSARLGEIGVPTLILHGLRDKLAPLAVAQEMHQGIAGSKLVTFKGGHLFFLIREPHRFLKTVADFVAS